MTSDEPEDTSLIFPAWEKFPAGVTVTDKRGNPEEGGFAGIVVDAPGFTALLPPDVKGINFAALEAMAQSLRKESASSGSGRASNSIEDGGDPGVPPTRSDLAVETAK